MDDTRAGRRLARPKDGRLVSGVAAGLSRRLGVRPGAVRLLLVALCVAGATLAVTFGVFDHRLFDGAPAPEGLRWSMIAVGCALVLLYPALALAMRDERGPGRWDFGSSVGMVLLLVLVGQALGTLLEPYWEAAKGAWIERGTSGFLTWPADYAADPGLGARDAILALFFLSAGAFLWMQRKAVRGFLRAMHTGVTLVVLTIVAVGVGVLVPQIDGFEDPDQRVDLAREQLDYELFRKNGYTKVPAAFEDGHEQYAAFRWAEGYFLYHALHLYGIGMPDVGLLPATEESLERFGRRYGEEEAANRRKGMAAAFSGREKTREIGAFVHRNEDAFWRAFELSTLLHLNRTYKSHWFAALLTLLGSAVLLNTYRGKPARWITIDKLGWFVVHHGVLILLVGGLVSKLLTDRGILQLYLDRPPQDTYWRHYDPSKKARLPFHVRLDRFGRQDWKALEVHFVDERFQSMPPRYTLWEGREIDLDYVDDPDGEVPRPRIRLIVDALHERTRVLRPTVREAEPGDEGAFPAAELRVALPGQGEQTLFLTPLLPPSVCFVDPALGYRLAASDAADPASVFPRDEEVVGVVEVSFPARGPEHRDLPVRLGETVEVGGYALSFVDATADFDPRTADATGSNADRPLAEQRHEVGAVWVDVRPVEGGPSERRIVLEEIDPVQHGLQSTYQHDEIVLRFAFDPWRAPGPPRHLLRWAAGSAPALFRQTPDGIESVPIEVGAALPIDGGTPIVLAELFERAAFEQNLEFLPRRLGEGGFDEDFYSSMPKGLELRVVHDPGTPQEHTETVRMATTEEGRANLWKSDDGRFVLVYLENTEMLPFEWRSVLSILERDNSGRLYEVPLGPEGEREIRVNDYFTHRGYRFFQTNADARMPTYSGIGVVYDPGIPIVLVGMYTIIAGTAIAFLVRPIVRAKRKGAS